MTLAVTADTRYMSDGLSDLFCLCISIVFVPIGYHTRVMSTLARRGDKSQRLGDTFQHHKSRHMSSFKILNFAK